MLCLSVYIVYIYINFTSFTPEQWSPRGKIIKEASLLKREHSKE